MSAKKKQIRAAFRNACFKRDHYRCVMCSAEVPGGVKPEDFLDAHHVCDRNEMPNGGYVAENGISLCATCHELAELFHSTGAAYPGYAPDDLYEAIGSNYDKAYKASERLQ